MEIKTEMLLRQADHLLEQLETEAPEIKKSIDSLRARVAALVHICQQGQEQIARFGLSMLSPEIDELIMCTNLRDTLPPDTERNA